MIDNTETLDTLQDICEENDWDLRTDYSGRGMYGTRCVGIVGPNPLEIVEAVASQTDLRGAQQDSMGRDAIVYWPGLSAEGWDHPATRS